MIDAAAPWDDRRADLAARISALVPIPPQETLIGAFRRWSQVRSLEFQLASEYGHRNGWRLADKEFSLRTLARNGVHDYGTGLEAPGASEAIDHPYWYRQNRRARALVAHLYDAAGQHSKITAWAAANGLRASFPTDFPSWWYPGYTTLVVYESAGL